MNLLFEKNSFLVDEKKNHWNKLLSSIMSLPSYHRARYQALKLLLDFLPVEELVDIRPSLFEELILSIKDRDIAASVSSLFLNLCQSLQQRSDSSSSAVVPFKELQLILCDALTSNDATLRINLADYLLPDLLKLSKYFDPLELLVFLLGDYSSREIIREDSSKDGFLWAAVQFVLHTKLNGLYEKIESDSSLSAVRERMMDFLKEAALGDDDMLRLTALTTLTVSQKTSAKLFPSEVALMKECFLFSLKSAESDNCSKIVRALRHYLIRAKYSSKETKNEENDIYEEILDWLFAAFSHSFLPGVIPHDKEYSHLIVIETIFETSFDNPTSKKSSAGNQGKVIEEPRVVKHLSKQFLSRLLRCLTSDFERSRKIVSQLLFQLPRPWVQQGISNKEELLPLLDWGKSLAESAKLKESDAGGQFIVSLFKIFCWDLKWNVFEDRCSTLCSIPLVDLLFGVEEIGKEEKERLISCVTFISYFANELESSVANLSRVFQRVKEQFIQKNGRRDEEQQEEETDGKEINRETDYPLAHGIVVVLKLSLQYFLKNGISLFPKRIISQLTKQILSLGLIALNSAMEIVAENKRKLNNENNQESSAKGPINSSVAISMAATFVNTNSFSGNDEEETGIVQGGQGGEEEEDDQEGTGTGGMNAQRAIVAAWLLVKESTALLAALVEMIPVPSKEEEEKEEEERTNNDILNQSEVENIGEVLLDTLGRLKHMGAIAEAHVALQSVCTTIFKYGEKNQKLTNLPFHWLKGLLDRLYSQRQIFILRRSAGFAYSFLSILRSEPSNANPVLLFHAMEALMTVVKKGIYFEEESNNNDNELVNDEKEKEEKEKTDYWKLSVHALNVIRLILLDSAFGNDLDRFIGDMMVFIIRGFQSPIWSVRNSSMMCFSAIIQRIVSRKDKNHQNNSFQFNRPNPSQKISDHGNMNIEEFFQRYSSLFPFLLNYFQRNPVFHNNEITNNLSLTTDMIGTTTTTSLSFQENQENSLFAILLFFSKFKLFVNNEAENKKEKENENQKEKEKEFPLTLFLPFFEKCLVADSSLQIRSIAAKAIVKIVPISQFPVLLKYKITELKAIIELSLFDNSDQTGGSVYRQRNQIHGRLLQILEFIQQYSNYSMIYFPFLYKRDSSSSSSSLKEQCDKEQNKVISEIHRVFLVIFRELVARFFSVYYHPLHSLVLVQIFHQFQFLLELYSLETEKEEILAMKNEFLVRYLVSTNKFIASSKLFPCFPLNVQSFYEILLQESPLTLVPFESKEETSFLSWIVSSKLIEKSSREVKLGILAGITSFVEKDKETVIQLEEFQYLSQQIMQRIVEEKDEVVLLSLIETFLR
jgi:hypothetical protein